MANKKSKLVKVQIGLHRFVKMHEEDAIAQGLSYEGEKRQKTPLNKMQVPQGDKAGKAEKPKAPKTVKGASTQPDDFTQIDGVGKATAKQLHEMGIKTFEQLMVAELDELNIFVRRSVLKWREEQAAAAAGGQGEPERIDDQDTDG